MSAEAGTDLDVRSSAVRAGEAQRVLERTRREATSLITSMAFQGQRLEFPRSALLRWAMRNLDLRMGAPLAMTLASVAGRLLIRRLFARRRGRAFEL